MLYVAPTVELALYLARGCYKNNLRDPGRRPSRLSSLRRPPQLRFHLKHPKTRTQHRAVLLLSKRGGDAAADVSPHAWPDGARRLLYHLGLLFFFLSLVPN